VDFSFLLLEGVGVVGRGEGVGVSAVYDGCGVSD